MSKLIDLKEFLSDSNTYFPNGEENLDLSDFLKVFDEPTQFIGEVSPISFSDFKQFIQDFSNLWSMDDVPDQFFDELSYLLNYEHDDRYTIAEERSILKDLIYEYKRKGTTRSFRGIGISLGIQIWVYNNVHKIIVPSKQGQLSGYSTLQSKQVGRTKNLIPSIIYHHEGYIQDARNIHEGVLDIVFTYTKYYDKFKRLIGKVAPAGYFLRYTERTQNTLSDAPSYGHGRSIELLDTSVNIFDVTFKNTSIGFDDTTIRASFSPKEGAISFG